MKKNSLSIEIMKTAAKIGFISLGVFIFTFIVSVISSLDTVNAFLVSTATGVAAVILLSLTLPISTAQRIARKINSDASGYAELDGFAKRITEREKESAKMLEELKKNHLKQDAMRRDFTANVSHELKTPLTSIKGYSELLKSGMVSEEDAVRFGGKIYDEAHRLITLVGDIIKLSQLDGNDVEVKIERLDLYELVLAVIGQFEMVAKEKKVAISLTGNHPFIMGPEQIVEEMVFNVIDNAVKYNKDGGEVKVRIVQRIDGVELEVKDTGIGIKEEDIPHIFERFWRADKSHSKEIGGTGLGLSIVKHGAMFIKARLSVESELGVGTTIRIVF